MEHLRKKSERLLERHVIHAYPAMLFLVEKKKERRSLVIATPNEFVDYRDENNESNKLDAFFGRINIGNKIFGSPELEF